MGKPIIVTVGEFLWDNFPDGSRLGGAPGNVACHASQLGAEAYLISAVGEDRLGRDALTFLREKGVHTDLVEVLSDYPTGTVTVSFDTQKKHSFHIDSPAAWDHIRINGETSEVLQKADALIFGTLGQRTPQAKAITAELLGLVSDDCLILCDANFRPPYDDHQLLELCLKRANALKINDEELAEFAPGQTPDDFFSSYKNLKLLIYTRGPKGAKVLRRSLDGIESVNHPGLPTNVVDTVGAGDSFTATLVTDLLNDVPLKTAVDHASAIASFVCENPGSVPELTTLPSSSIDA